MKTIKIMFDPKTGQLFNLDKIPENIQAKISALYLVGKRNKKLSSKEKSDIAKKAAKASAEVRIEKARLKRLGQVV